MKRLLISAAAIAMLAPAAVTAKRMPAKVQGIDYGATLPQDGRMKVSDWEWDPNPEAPAMSSADFGFDDIENWTGDGENQAALVIQWNDSQETHAVVFGYRWNGQATGADMLKAVVRNNPRLYTLMQYTNVSSPTDPNGGYTINGIGWDADNDGEISLVDTKDGMIYTSEDGFFEHPRGYKPGSGGSSDYDYDDWESTDDGDFWQAGWYMGYWSYWVGEGEHPSSLSYSSWGASGRVLENNSWDGWNYAVDMIYGDWKELKSAPSLIPDGARTEFKVGDLFYSLTDYSKGTVRVVNPSALTTITGASYRDFNGESIVIPATFYDDEEDKTYTVIAIDDNAFSGVAGIVSVTIPATVTKIGKRAFYQCLDLAELKGADGTDPNATITSIGEAAFESCDPFATPLFPTAMKALPKRIYAYCDLIGNLVIPSHIEEMGDSAFAYTSVRTIEIPASVKKIGTKAIYSRNIANVKSLSLYPAEMAADAFMEKVYENAELTVPAGFTDTYAGAAGWSNFKNFAEETIPVNAGDIFSSENVTYVVEDTSEETPSVRITHARVDGKPDANAVKAANKAAYAGEITVPEKISFMGRDYAVTEINDSAFYGASEMTSLTIKAKIENIGAYTFSDCSKLTDVVLPATLKTIGRHAFSYAGVTSMRLPEGLVSLGERAFFQCSAMASVNVPASVTSIADYCFSYCTALTSLEFGDNITSFGRNMMQSSKNLRSVRLPGSLAKIPDNTFSSCSALTSVTIPATVTEIGASAFAGCSSLTVSLPESVNKIGTAAFQDCANETFTLPEAITAIPNNLFNSCKNLHTVTLGNGITSIGTSAFASCSALVSLRVAENQDTPSDAAQRTAAESTGLAFPATLKSIGSYAFQKCTSITSVSIPENVTTVSPNAFQDCTGLVEAELPNSIKSGPNNLFQGCSNLQKVTLGNALTSIGQNMFRDCASLEYLAVRGTETGDGVAAFSLPSTLKTIGTWAFANCKKIKSVIIPEGVTSIGANDFDGCSALESVKLPSKLTSIGNYAFRNTLVKELVLPASVGNMSYTSDILYGCPDGATVYVCNTGNPKTAGSNLWRMATGKYAAVMVPVGLKEKYASASGWKNSTVSEAEISSLDYSLTIDNTATDEVSIMVNAAYVFGGELPEAFEAANNEVLFSDNTSYFFHYREKETPENDSPVPAAAEEDTFTTTGLLLDSDGCGTFTMARPFTTTVYEVKVSGRHPSGTVETEPKTVTVTGNDVLTGVESVADADSAGTHVFTLDGTEVNADGALEPGIYILVRGGKTSKIIVR